MTATTRDDPHGQLPTGDVDKAVCALVDTNLEVDALISGVARPRWVSSETLIGDSHMPGQWGLGIYCFACFGWTGLNNR